MDFNAYVARFNEGDEPKLGELFFTPDIVFDGGNRRFAGRENLVHYLHNVAIGIRQTMTPVVVVRSDNHIMAELDIEFRATEDKSEFPFGALQTGESMTFRFFGSYYLRGERIERIHLGNWPSPIRGKGTDA